MNAPGPLLAGPSVRDGPSTRSCLRSHRDGARIAVVLDAGAGRHSGAQHLPPYLRVAALHVPALEVPMRPAPHRGSARPQPRPAPVATVVALVVASLATLTPCRSPAQGLPPATPESVGLSSATLARLEPAMRAYTDSGKLAG